MTRNHATNNEGTPMKKLSAIAMLVAGCLTTLLSPIRATDASDDSKQLTVRTELWRTPYKPQGQTGMCWAFSTTSFLESELKRLGRGEFELSQAFIAYHAYLEKSRRYVYRQGGGVFGQGGLPHDVLHVMRKYGAAPLESYSGLLEGNRQHAHNEMFAILNGVLEGVIASGNKGNLSGKWVGGELKSLWLDDFRDILDNHLGVPPRSFKHGGRALTPQQFADQVLALPYDEYVEITSYSYLPLNARGELALHDNWLHYGGYYNVALDDLIAIIDHAIETGYSLVFDLHTTSGLYKSLSGHAELAEDLEKSGIDTDARDTMLENWSTVDVHLVHCVGIAADENGKKYYLIKDSWGADEGPYEDLEYLSENFVRAKALFIMVHKDGLPSGVKKKLGIK
jgi:bleomycin hydrolase